MEALGITVLGGIIVIIIAFSIIGYFIPVGLWLSARFAGVPIGIYNLFGMRMRKVTPAYIVHPLIKAHKANIPITSDQLETHFLAGGNVDRVVDSLIAAHRAQLNLGFEKACAIDLAGRNVFEAVQMSVNPKVIDIPSVVGTARDGIQLNVKARVTVRANLERLVGGATEATVVARVGQGVVAAVGSSDSYKDVMENPIHISKTVLDQGLDAGTAFEILSIDIADIDIGRNIGAELQASQAEADMRTATAKAQEKKAMAEAQEQEMKALTQEMRAKVVEAEAEIPKAISSALVSGKLGVLDYYNLKNIQADTSMRESIGKNPTT